MDIRYSGPHDVAEVAVIRPEPIARGETVSVSPELGEALIAGGQFEAAVDNSGQDNASE